MILTRGMQTDLRVETVHLRRFYNNFASVRSSVTPPLPVPGMDTEAVLVETYEAGAHQPLTLRLYTYPACSIVVATCSLTQSCRLCGAWLG